MSSLRRFIHIFIFGLLVSLSAFAEQDLLVKKFLQEIDPVALKDLSTVQVGTASTSRLQNAKSLPELSAWILESIRNCSSPCHLKFGPNNYVIQTPALGEGERGVVFRVLENNKSYVIKIAKPELKSIAILRAEAQSHSFWTQHQTSNFSVPARIVTHPSGIFSVMQEIKGEPLTNALFRLGLLQMDPVGGDVMASSDAKHIASSEQEKIWKTLQDLIRIVKKNPEMKTSLSPNNIFVTWKGDGSIDRISLIDFGIDGTGDSRYFELKNLQEYLNLSAIKIKGYLAKPGYVSPDLFEIQKEAQSRYKLAPLFDENAYRPLLEEIAKKIAPGKNVNELTISEILDMPIPEKWAMKLKVGTVTFMPAKTVKDLTHTAVALNYMISRQNSGILEIQLARWTSF